MDYLRGVIIDEKRMTLMWISKEWDMWVWTGFLRFWTGTNGEFR